MCGDSELGGMGILESHAIPILYPYYYGSRVCCCNKQKYQDIVYAFFAMRDGDSEFTNSRPIS